MASSYKASGTCTTGTNKTALSLTSDGNTRGFVQYIAIGIAATPADTYTSWKVQRCTAVGTGTTVTSALDDPADGSPRCVATSNHSAEPTYTANTELFHWSINQRTSFQWFANHGPLVIPKTSANGIGVFSAASGASAASAVVVGWEE